jgi:histidinol dehydrogenase
MEETPIPATMQAGIIKIFGEALSPAQIVERIMEDVKERGDAALCEWTEKLDGKAPKDISISKEEIKTGLLNIPDTLRADIEKAAGRIRSFHEAQPLSSWMTQDMGGTLGQLVRPIRRVGLYIPAGSAPLPSTLLMSAIPAQVAGVSEIALVAPPQFGTGKVSPIILGTAAMLGIDEVYAIGGAQAISALAYGTESIAPVDKIYGPGNLFVSLAKRRVFGRVGIDSIAGPTETMIIADEGARPEWIAADLLAQAEHDFLAAAILVTPSERLIFLVQSEVQKQIGMRDRQEIINGSLEKRSGAIQVNDLDEAVELANMYAPEHLCLSVKNPWKLAEKVYAAGGIFMGEHSCEVLGDYVAGPSHVMPTGGSARFSSPLNVLDFVNFVSLVALNPETTRQIAPTAAALALSEGLDAHANAAQVRIDQTQIDPGEPI